MATEFFKKGQIVKGKVLGTFLVMGHKMVGGMPMVVVKEVNPADHNQVGRGQLCLPAEALVAV